MDLRIESEHAYGRESTLRIALENGHTGKTLRVLTYRPSDLDADTPVLIAMHGVTRDADDYLLSWAPLAERYRFLLIVPEFTKADWPGSRSYNLGNMRRQNGRPVPREDWSFTLVDQMFDEVCRVFGSNAKHYRLYGHSAGAQFVHRFLTFTGGVRVNRTVAANAGWYTVPDPDIPFPYGLQGEGVADETLRLAFRTNMVVLLGADDNDPNAPDLRQAAEAQAQGPHRLARGKHYVTRARALAHEMGAPFYWQAQEVPKVGHSDRAMAPFAAQVLFPERRR